MLRIKQQYFLCYGILGSVAPYGSIYLEQRGLSDAQIGYVMSLGGVSVLLMPVLTALLADLHLTHRVLLRCVGLGAATALSLLLASWGFGWLMLTFWLWTLVMAPVMPLLDGLVFSERSRIESEGGRAEAYHRIRVFGTMGFIAPSFLLYFLIDRGASVGPALGCGIGVALFAAMNTFFLPGGRGPLGEPIPPTEVPDGHAPKPGRGGKDVPTLLALKRMMQPDIALFCAAMWLVQIPTSAYYAFYPVYLTRTLEVGEQWLGLISSIGVVLEVGYVLAFGWLLKKVGLKWLVAMGLASILVRMVLLAGVPSVGVAVGTQVLHGMSVLALFVIPPLYLNHRAEPRFRNSMQGLYAMIVFGTGRIAGTVLAGQLAEHGEHQILTAFGVTAGIAGVALLMFVVFFRDRSTTPIEP